MLMFLGKHVVDTLEAQEVVENRMIDEKSHRMPIFSDQRALMATPVANAATDSNADKAIGDTVYSHYGSEYESDSSISDIDIEKFQMTSTYSLVCKIPSEN